MITKVFFLCTFALAVQSFPQNVQLLSKVPSEPIEDPNSWAWGRHPKNGYGYKARNTLTVDQCLKNRHLVDTPQCSFPAQLCIDNPEFIPLKACDDADFPKDFCVSNAAKMIKVNGCKPFLNDLCTTDVSLAVSADCADAEFPKDFCVSNAVKMIKVKGCSPYKTDLCTTDISLAVSTDCADAEFPKDFCVSNAVKMIKVKGCASYKADLCTADISLALSSDCAGVEFPPEACTSSVQFALLANCKGAAADVTFFQCTSDPDVCRSTICEKRVPNKDFCP